MDDPLYETAVSVVRAANPPSTANLQRTLQIGYNRASRLMDAMIENGILVRFENEHAVTYCACYRLAPIKQRGVALVELGIDIVVIMAAVLAALIYFKYDTRPLSGDELRELQALAKTNCNGNKTLKAALAEKIEFSPHDLDKLRGSLKRIDEKSAAEKVRGEILGKNGKESCD